MKKANVNYWRLASTSVKAGDTVWEQSVTPKKHYAEGYAGADGNHIYLWAFGYWDSLYWLRLLAVNKATGVVVWDKDYSYNWKNYNKIFDLPTGIHDEVFSRLKELGVQLLLAQPNQTLLASANIAFNISGSRLSAMNHLTGEVIWDKTMSDSIFATTTGGEDFLFIGYSYTQTVQAFKLMGLPWQ